MEVKLYQKKDRGLYSPSRLFYHPQQAELWRATTRFNATCAGRRSGKSDIARRKLAVRALRAHTELKHPDPRFFIAAPTREQVKRLHWEQLKMLIPKNFVFWMGENALSMILKNNVRIDLLGMDRPERAEGLAYDGGILDEIADLKEESWTLSLRPSLSTLGRPGWAEFIGKPRGRNHWYRIWTEAAEKKVWGQFHWNAEDILDEEEIASLKEDLDPISYEQEVKANFVNFQGRTYYAFVRGVQDSHRLEYDEKRPLDLHFDFNIEPGTAGVSQEQVWERKTRFEPVWIAGEWVEPWIQGPYTALIDEVWIKTGSTTLRVIKEIIRKWGDRHTGLVNVYGDQTGGAGRSSALHGSDWDIIKRELRKVKNWAVRYHIPSKNPYERDRVNSVNARCMSSDGRVRLMADPVLARYHCDDLEGVIGKADGSGDIDKSNKWLTHCSDGLGYKIWKRFPMKGRGIRGVEQV